MLKCEEGYQGQGFLLLKPERVPPDKQCKKTLFQHEVLMEVLAQYPLIRYVVEVMFIIAFTALLLGIIVWGWSLLTRSFSFAERQSRWKRPDEMGLGCWKVPK